MESGPLEESILSDAGRFGKFQPKHELICGRGTKVNFKK